MTARAIAADVAAGRSAVEVTNGALARCRADDHGALLFVDGERALAAASSVDRARDAGESLGPLAGVPVVLKDNLCARGTPTTCASRLLEGWVAPYDATVVARLKRAGAVPIAKANMDEFAMGSSSETGAFGPVRNPRDPSRSAGGSSGGSAAAVAADLAPLALGSDTGGSVRQPAAFCGVVGVKPTYGRVSRYGLVAFASSFDQVGPLAANVRDAARLLAVIAGDDPRDATAAPVRVDDYEAACDASPRLRVGVLDDALAHAPDPIRAEVESAAEALVAAGAERVSVALPHAEHALAAYYLIAPAEASSNLARFDGVRYGHRDTRATLDATYAATRAAFGAEVKRRIVLGTYALSAGYYDAYYLRAQKVRTLLCRDYDAAFEGCDVILGPTAPEVAFPLGARVDDPLAMYASDVFTLPASLAGLPAISVPFGTHDALPVGVQLVAPAFEEARLFTAAAALEASR